MSKVTQTMASPAFSFEQLEEKANAFHPYARYGLAVAYLEQNSSRSNFAENLSTHLSEAIERAFQHFLIFTTDDPETSATLKFRRIPLVDLEEGRVDAKPIAAKGQYMLPTVVATNLTASSAFTKARELRNTVRSGASLEKTEGLQRSFAPFSGKFNAGKATQTEPKGSLLEIAACLIATYTDKKPAFYARLRGAKDKDDDRERINTCIIPDLPFREMVQFVSVFRRMQETSTSEQQLTTTLKKAKVTETKSSKGSNKDEKEEGNKFRRPPIFDGNFPYAPRDGGLLGPVGLLASIGQWAKESKNVESAFPVLESLSGKNLLLVSQEQISQIPVSHQLVRLAEEQRLSEILTALYVGTRFPTKLNVALLYKDPMFKMFCTLAGRFIGQMTPTAFGDFLSIRAEYDPQIQPLFNHYFQAMNIPSEIVQSARHLGAWINKAAARVASADTKGKPYSEFAEAKAKIVVTLESVVFSAKTSSAMISQLLIQAGRMAQDDVPQEATRFIDAVYTGAISHQLAKDLLTSYMRLRTESRKAGAKPEEMNDEEDTHADAPSTETN